jgi:hypothetical protein
MERANGMGRFANSVREQGEAIVMQRVLFGAVALVLAYGSTASATEPVRVRAEPWLAGRLHKSPPAPPPAPLSSAQRLQLFRSIRPRIQATGQHAQTLGAFAANSLGPSTIKLSLAQAAVPGAHLEFDNASGDAGDNLLLLGPDPLLVRAVLTLGHTYLMDVTIQSDSPSYQIVYGCGLDPAGGTTLTIPVINGHVVAPIVAAGSSSACWITISPNSGAVSGFYGLEISEAS